MSIKVHNLSITKPRKLIASAMLASFLLNVIAYPAGAQVLPPPGTSIGLTVGFQPPVLLGLKIHPENPLLFDFIVDQGLSKLSEDELKLETEKLVKYFLAALTISDQEVWVNLSPYEKDRIIPDVLGQTVMGKAMLEQDYMLKQLASSLTDPDEKIGQEFWSRVKAEVRNKLGNTDVPMNTFNKVWIVPQKAEVLESQGIVIVGDKRLKVMMDQDYVALSNQKDNAESPSLVGTGRATARDGISEISSGVFRDTILPNIEKEINEGKNFADVRQIYNSVILAAWYKQALKESLLGKVYADKGKVAGVETDDKEMKQRIYEQYIAAFKKGVYNLIREESDSATGDMIPRKYFSGGAMLGGTRRLLVSVKVSSAVIEKNLRASSSISTAMVRLAEDRQEAVASSTIFEQANFITIRSGKLFAQMRQEIPELNLSEFRPQDTGIIYQLFTGVYRGLADRIIADREGRSVEDIVNNRVEMSEVWFSALKSNFQWNSFNADIRKRSEEILAGVGLNGSRDVLPSVQKALISSLTADFIDQWQKMNEREDQPRASSSVGETLGKVLDQSDAKIRKDTAALSSVSVVNRIRQLGLRKGETIELPTGTIVIWKTLQGLIYTFVNVRARPAYKNVIPKSGFLEGDFRNTPISDLDKMLQQQAPWLADAEVKFVGEIPSHQLITDERDRTIAAINSGRLQLLSKKAFGMGTLIVFADREAILVPGSALALDPNETKIKKILAIQGDFMPKWVNLGKYNVLVKYLGLVRINDQWRELTQFTAVYNNPAGRFQRFAGIAYLDGNQAKAPFLSWDHIQSQQADVDFAAASSVANELDPADSARIEEFKAPPPSAPAAVSSAIKKEVGGINFDPANMNLQIKRDGQGVPLPLPQQNLEQINIQGFFPVIINIQPVNTQTLPVLLGQGDPQEKLSFLN